ncbi:unnamed protein product [Amaranthus hypochondriacus]
MLDSNSKHPENRIHLYDPVGLLNDGYGGFKPSNHTFKPRRQALSYDHDPNLGLRSYDSTASLRSYDSFEVDSFALPSSSFNETFTFETSNGANSHENGGDNTNTNTSMIIEDRNDGGLRFVVVDSVVEDDDQSSDPSTPQLWRSTSPKSFPSKSVEFPAVNPLNCNQQSYQAMSPRSRTQAIAKGRRELMDMVRDLPETFYELSLKDIVEQKGGVDMEVKKEIDIPEEKKPIMAVKEGKEMKKQRKNGKRVKKSESKKKMVRSRSVDNGKFLLKTSVFPFLGSRKSKKNLNATSSFKVAPMPKGGQTSNGHVKFGEKEWWRKKSCISSESEESNGLSSQSTSSRSSSSSSSNSSNGRRSNRLLPNCCIFNGKRIGGKK